MKKFRRAITAFVCAVVLVSAAAVIPQSRVSVSAASISDLQKQLEAAKAQSNQLKSEAEALKKANAPYQERKAALKKQISATENEIALYEKKISTVNSSIKSLEDSISSKRAEVAKLISRFKQRLVAIYTAGSSVYSGLEYLMSSEDMAEYLVRAELLESMSKKDSESLSRILASVKELEAQQAELETQKAELASAQSTIEQKKKDLSAQYSEVAAIVKANENDIASYEKKAADYAQMQKDLRAAIKKQQEEEAKNNKPGPTGTGQFSWPVPGYYRLSENYGYRICPIHGKEFHKGIDISSSGIYGAKIVAADSGTVVLSKWYGGYGNCIMINHNNGYITLYAHMKAASPLKVGDKVTKGQTVVGYVGSTGDSTGPHLHFEVQKNGSTVNPMSFF